MLSYFQRFCAMCNWKICAADCKIHASSQALNHDSPRGGVAIVTDKSSPVTSTSLLLPKARLSDSGKYSCNPSNADPVSPQIP